jgi:hypothetical protein
MGVSILGSVVIDAVAARNLDLSKAFCILLILAGAAGLKLGEKADMLSELPAATRRANSGCDRGVSP